MSSSVKTLSDICDIQIGKTPSRANSRYWGTGYPWLSIADMNQGETVSETKEQITDAAISECGCKLIPANTLLMSFKLSVGKLAINRVPMFTNEAIAALQIKDPSAVCQRYLLHLLSASTGEMMAATDRAVLGATLNKAKLSVLPIALPGLDEQKRIAAILDKADSLRRKRQQAIRLADDFLRAVFVDMFGDPVTNSGKWPEKEIYEIAKVTTGNTPSREMPENFGATIEWIKSDNINTPSHWLTKATEGLSEQGLSLGRTAPAGSTLMTCIAGSPSCIGNVAMADREVAFNQQINALTPFEGTEPEFLYGLLLYSKQRVQDASTNSMKGMVSKGSLERVRLIWPPADLQSTYARAFKKITALREKQLESDYSPLFSSLQDNFLS